MRVTTTQLLLASPAFQDFPFLAFFRKNIRIGHAERDVFGLRSAEEGGLQVGREIFQELKQIFISQLRGFLANFLHKSPTIGDAIIPDIPDDPRGILGMPAGVGVIGEIFHRPGDNALIIGVDLK